MSKLEPFRVVFGWSNCKDFASLKEAIDFINAWERPASWGTDRLKRDPSFVMDKRVKEDGLLKIVWEAR